jgi:hypothetical protein
MNKLDISDNCDSLRIESIELLEWLRTFNSLEKRENCWVLGREISSEQLYEGYLNDREQWLKNKNNVFEFDYIKMATCNKTDTYDEKVKRFITY